MLPKGSASAARSAPNQEEADRLGQKLSLLGLKLNLGNEALVS
jgi:hypothetical protein